MVNKKLLNGVKVALFIHHSYIAVRTFGEICLFDVYKIVHDRAWNWKYRDENKFPPFSIDAYTYGYKKLYGCQIEIVQVDNYGEDRIFENREYYYRLKYQEPIKL